jgi:hypothetical protein
MKMNWKQGDQERIMYPNGTYKVQIDRWEYTEASTGTKQVRWFGTVVDHEEYEGKSIVAHCPLTEASLWKLATFMACHVDVSKLADMEVQSTAWEQVLDMAKGRTMYWRMEQRTYNGKQSSSPVEFTKDSDLPIQKEISIKDLEDLPEFLNEETEAI